MIYIVIYNLKIIHKYNVFQSTKGTQKIWFYHDNKTMAMSYYFFARDRINVSSQVGVGVMTYSAQGNRVPNITKLSYSNTHIWPLFWGEGIQWGLDWLTTQ